MNNEKTIAVIVKNRDGTSTIKTVEEYASENPGTDTKKIRREAQPVEVTILSPKRGRR